MNTRKEKIEKIITNSQSFRRQMMVEGNSIHKELGITMSQAGVLCIIKRQKEVGVSELAAKIGISKSAVTQVIDALIEKDLACREVDLHDKRGQKIRLSEKSQKQMTNFRAKIMNHFLKMFESLSDEEIDQFEKITTKLDRAANDKDH